MKPRLRRVLGYWHCGLPCDEWFWWACAPTPAEAYELWARGRQ